MFLLRTALALGALTMSVPVEAQDSRYGWDRSRAERRSDTPQGREDRGKNGDRSADRGSKGTDQRTAPKGESRPTPWMTPRVDPRNAPREQPRDESRPGARVGGWVDRNDDRRAGNGDGRGWDRGDVRNFPDGRGFRRDEPRIVVRQPVVIDRRDGRYDGRYTPGNRERYRYGDRDYRNRDLITITTWFRALPTARLHAYGYYGPGYGGVRYAFRPGLVLSFAVFSELQLLPYEIEYELGELPWYLERRIYGNTVLVIDTRTRYIVDIFDIDY